MSYYSNLDHDVKLPRCDTIPLPAEGSVEYSADGTIDIDDESTIFENLETTIPVLSLKIKQEDSDIYNTVWYVILNNCFKMSGFFIGQTVKHWCKLAIGVLSRNIPTITKVDFPWSDIMLLYVHLPQKQNNCRIY